MLVEIYRYALVYKVRIFKQFRQSDWNVYIGAYNYGSQKKTCKNKQMTRQTNDKERVSKLEKVVVLIEAKRRKRLRTRSP